MITERELKLADGDVKAETTNYWPKDLPKPSFAVHAGYASTLAQIRALPDRAS